MVSTDIESARRALLERLSSHRLFEALAAKQLEVLASKARRHTISAGETIFLEGMPSSGMWIILEGQVKIFKLSFDGHEHILHLLGPGDSFNDISALDGGPHPANAAALSSVCACSISSEALQEAIMADPELAMTLIAALAGRTRSLVRQIEDLAFYSVTTRLARFLLEQMDNPALNGPVITRTAIAAHLATKPETVSRALGTLEKSGVICADRQRITVKRADLLRMVAML